MDNSVDFCSLCLKYNSNLKNVKWLDEDGKMVQEKLTSFLPECMLMETEISVYICNDCLQVINNTLTFRKQCLDNVNILKEYVQKLKAVDNSSTYLSLRLPDILYYKQYKTSQAKFSTDSPESKIETPQNSTDNKDIENIVVKVENTSDGEDYMKEEINEEYNIKDEEMQDNFVDCNVIIKTETEETSEDKHENDNSNIDKSDQEDQILSTPPEIIVAAKSVPPNFLPSKSRYQYERTYKLFMDWRQENQTTSLSENVLLAYFQNLSKKMKPSSLWATYSMLRSTINIKHNIDISCYNQLCAYIKQQSDGYKPKKSKTLTPQQIEEFLSFAPDEKYLFTKVGLIFGLIGACRREDLTKIETNHVEDLKTALLVHVPDTKTKTERQFVIGGNYYKICKQYMDLRPQNLTNTTRFFLNYQRGRCTQQHVGINKFGSLPSEVAKFLNLPDPSSYTGHCLRRPSATILVDSGADISALNRYGGWHSTSVAEGYIGHSFNNQMETADQILHTVEDTRSDTVMNWGGPIIK